MASAECDSLAIAEKFPEMAEFGNCPGTPAKRGLQAVLSRKNIFDVRKVAHSPPYRGVPGHARGGTWAVTIEANLERSIGLTEMAAVAALSPVHFARQFRRAMGQAPHQHLLHGPWQGFAPRTHTSACAQR